MSKADLDPMASLGALGVSGVTAATPVSGGWDTAIWRVDCGGKAYALRVFRAGEDETCRREVEVMRAAAAGGIAVPTVHAEGSWRDRPAMLLLSLSLMVRDLAPKIGRPGIWLQPHHLERIRRWANRWKWRAGI